MKIFLAIVAAFAAAMILLFIAPFVVPTSQYKEAVIDEIKQFADTDVTIDSFRFQMLPYPAFTIRGLTVTTTKAPFQGVPIFHAAVVQGGLSPGPLFRGKIVTDFTVGDATFDYRVAADGTTNVSLLARENEGAKEHKKSYVIRSLIITNGTFRYEKEGEPNPGVIDQIELATSELKLAESASASIRLSAVLEGAARQAVVLSGTFLADRQQKIVQARRMDLTYGGSRFSIDGSYKYDTKSVDIHLATPSITIQSLGIVIPSLAHGLPFGIDLAGPFALDTQLSGTKENLAVKCQIDATESKFSLGSVFNKDSGRPFKIVFSGTYQPTNVAIEDVVFSIGESTFHLAGSVVDQPGLPSQITLSSTAFDANELKNYFPFLTIFDELSSPAIEINIQGPLLAETGRTITGRVSAAKATAFGHTLGNLESDFQYGADQITLSTLKGVLYDGVLSGNGSIDLKATPAFHFELVADNLDTAKIPTLPAVMTGAASLVFKADAAGTDNISIKDSLSSEGTLVMANGQVSPIKVGQQILTEAVWKALEPYIKGGLDVATRDGLMALESDVKDMKASFNFKSGMLTISRIEWSHPQYQLQGKGTISLPGEVSGDGSIFISKDATAHLIKDPASRKAVTTNDGTLEVPFIVGGTLLAMSVKPDDIKLGENLRRTATPVAAPVTAPPPSPPEQPAPATAAPAPAPVPTPAPAPAAPAVAAPTPAPTTTPPPAAPVVKKAKPKPKPAEAAPAPTEEEQPAKPSKKKGAKGTTKGKMSTDIDEDTMKVIIGQ